MRPVKGKDSDVHEEENQTPLQASERWRQAAGWGGWGVSSGEDG